MISSPARGNRRFNRQNRSETKTRCAVYSTSWGRLVRAPVAPFNALSGQPQGARLVRHASPRCHARAPRGRDFSWSLRLCPAHRCIGEASFRQLAQAIADAGAPGAIVAVRDSTATRVGAAGFANLRTRERLRPADTFRVGSISKSFVATVVLQLVGEGVLSLDDPVEKWLPGLVPHGGWITLNAAQSHERDLQLHRRQGVSSLLRRGPPARLHPQGARYARGRTPAAPRVA